MDPQDVIDSVFAEFGVGATYTPSGGEGVEVTVMPSQETETFQGVGELQVDQDVAHFEVRATEITPTLGGILTIGTQEFTVRRAPRYRDPRQLVWLLECGE